MFNIDITTDEKKKEIFELFSSFTKLKDIFSYYGVSRNTTNSNYIHKICEEIGFDVSQYHKKPKRYCLFCGKEIDESRDYRSKFCDSSCAAKYNNSKRIVSDETKQRISEKLKSKISLGENVTKTPKVHSKNIKLKDRLFRDGLKEYKCECCGISEWNGKPITLHLHHINGNHNDNSLENLQILCPNCHSQTDNFCHRNRKQFGEKKKYYCIKCGKELYQDNKTHLCAECYKTYQLEHVSQCPTKDVLLEDFTNLKAKSLIAKKYDVSARTITKWLAKYDIC